MGQVLGYGVMHDRVEMTKNLKNLEKQSPRLYIQLVILIIHCKTQHYSFNILLTCLAAYDTYYMVGAVLETIRKFFPFLRSDIHVKLFPHLLYPLHQTSITGSIFMTVALAFERYTALNYPLEYNRVSSTDRCFFATLTQRHYGYF